MKFPHRLKLSKLWQNPAWRTFSGLVVALLIFSLGVGIGDGRISWSSHSGQNPNLPNQLNYSSVNQVYQLLKSDYNGKLTENQLLDGMKEGLTAATGDPYTEYFTPAQAKQFENALQGTFSGIGAELGQDEQGDVEVIAPVSGSPAAQAGLMAKDLISSIDGVSTSGMNVDTAVSKIRGPAGSKVTLGILRNQSQQLTITITRANITVPSVNSQVLAGNIGYMQINQFSDDTSSLAQKAADQFKGASVKGVILDLRDNPGGEVNAAVNVSSLWLPPGTLIMQEKRGSVVAQTYTASGNDPLHGIPTVVLINSGSASAAEITTGALHDNRAAYVIGEKSYGKGVVQELDNLGGGAELKITVASWYRPNGQNINHLGITPDQTVGLSSSDLQAGNDPQKTAALNYLAAH